MAKTPKKPKRPPERAAPPKQPAPPARKPKVREDLNQLAARIVAESVGEAERTPDPDEGKSAAAIARGRKGGAKGGAARAAKLTAEERAAIAKKAAEARWRTEDQVS
jgi:hypothetical protein